MSPALAGGFLTTAPPGKPFLNFLSVIRHVHESSVPVEYEGQAKCLLLYLRGFITLVEGHKVKE